MPLSASLTCTLKQTDFTGDLPVEDNETDQCGSERGRGPLTKGLMKWVEVSRGSLQVQLDEEPGDKEMLNTPSSLWTYRAETRRHCPWPV